MKKFKADSYSDNQIVLQNAAELDDFIKTVLDNEENFILIWGEGDKTVSKLVMTSNIIGKLRNGAIEVLSIDKE